MDALQRRWSEAPALGSLQSSEDAVRQTTKEQEKGIESTNLSFRVVEPATINVRNLNIHTCSARSPLASAKALFGKSGDTSTRQISRQKTILNGITARMPPGSLTAIMGASGSGKTSFHPRFCLSTPFANRVLEPFSTP